MTIVQILVIARWAHFASVFVLFGAALFWFYAQGGPLPAAALWPRSFRATRRLLCAAAIAAAVSGLAWTAAILVNISSDPAAPDWRCLTDAQGWRLFLFETDFGAVALIRALLLASAVGAVALRLPARGLLAALVLIGAALLVSQAWLGHAAEGGAGLKGAVMIAAYGVHLLAGAAWIGGLAPLLLVLVESRRAGRATETAQALDRFSAIGLIAVALIVASGMANAGFHVAGFADRLFETAYGRTLAVKLALFAVLLALACLNRFALLPRLRRAGEGDREARALTRNVAVELIVGALVLAAAAVLGVTPPSP